MPPTIVTTFNLLYLHNNLASSAICMASSRVGAKIILRGSESNCSSIGLSRKSVINVNKKAAVLPVPVCALPTTSTPAKL